ncbi:WD40 repeat domain-containing protein [Dactylosporangium sp. NPDC000521]|uniref:WD40 repeat domain-containing protein n=1 Tax=Dactylosporangium sp. NPDC000521 TaxID=3363975 RepID=UPI0036CB47BD
MAVLLVLAVLGGAVAIRQRQDARRQQVAAPAEEVSLRSRSLLATDPELAGLLAVEAERLHSTTETRGAVLSAAVTPRRLELNVGGPSIYAVAFDPGRSLLASAAGDGTIGLWDPARGTRTGTLTGHSGRAANVAFNGDGARLASVGIDGAKGSVIIWDVATGRPVHRFDDDNLGSAMAFSPDGATVAVAKGNTIALFHVGTGGRTVLGGQGPAIGSLTFSHDGTLLASADGHAPKVWNVAVGTVAAENGAITVWDLRRRERLETLQDRGRTETVTVALSRDGTYLASAGFNGTIVLHDLAARRFGGFTARVHDVKAGPAGSDGTVGLWDTDGKALTVLSGLGDEVQTVAFHPAGRCSPASPVPTPSPSGTSGWAGPRRRRCAPTARASPPTSPSTPPAGSSPRRPSAPRCGTCGTAARRSTAPPRSTSGSSRRWCSRPTAAGSSARAPVASSTCGTPRPDAS